MIVMTLIGCAGGMAAQAPDVAPVDIADAECAVCSMIVAEQPAPRAQLAWRDGSADHLCSLAELRAMGSLPSPKGEPVGVWVEALPGDHDESGVARDPLPWVPADDAWFVFGATRPTVMGLPVLSFATQAAAQPAATRLGTTPVRWEAIAAAPIGQIPEAARGETR